MTTVAAPSRATRPTVSGWAQLVTLTRAMMREFLRDRATLFVTFFFPLLLLVVFGLVFRDDTANAQKIAVVGSGPVVTNLPPEALKTQRFTDVDAALAKVRKGDLPAVLVEDGTTLTLRYAASDTVRAATIQGIIGSVVSSANVAAAGRPPTYRLVASRVEDQNLKSIQFLTPGILSWGIASSAMFWAALTLVSWRRKQLLRRLRLSPAPAWSVVGSRVGVSLLVALVQAAVFLGVATLPAFGLKLTGHWWLAVPLLLCGTLAFLSIGLLIGAVAKTDEAASAMANFVFLPMAFLSGLFFPITQAPAWLQAGSKIFPLRWLNDGTLDVLARGQSYGAIVVPALVLLVFAAVLTTIATRVFQWDDL